MMAAAETQRDVSYYTFNEKNLSTELLEIYQFIIEKELNVGMFQLNL